MALNAYLTLEGETQGRVEGSVTQTGREGQMEVYGFSHEVISPRDAASGLPTGKRQHKPFTVTKPVDQASPLLMAILTQNENITTWTLRCYKPSADGAEENYYTVQLENATIAAIRQEQLNNKYPENTSHAMREHVSFTYQRITWTHENPAKVAQDDWPTPDEVEG